MYPSGKPCPCFTPPVFLSPIHESVEETPHLTTKFTKSESDIEELNNSSLIPKGISKSLSGGTNRDSRLVGKGRLRTDKALIESCSGRKHEDVEVVKQKYINSEIQDLPRFIHGPLRYSHIHRTDSSPLNLGSQDITNQMKKIRLHARTSLTTVGTEKKQEYRCKKYSEHSEKCHKIQNSVEGIQYGDFNNDDFDPELALLFENFIEECEDKNRTEMEPLKHFSHYPSELSVKEKEERLSERQLEMGTKHAFMCGYIEGLKQTSHSLDANESERCVQDDTLIDEGLPSALGLRNLISHQQDVTHSSLREWEQENGLEQPQREEKRKELISSLQSNKRQSEDLQSMQEANSVPTEKQTRNQEPRDASLKATFPLSTAQIKLQKPDKQPNKKEMMSDDRGLPEKKPRTEGLQYQHAVSSPPCKEISHLITENRVVYDQTGNGKENYVMQGIHKVLNTDRRSDIEDEFPVKSSSKEYWEGNPLLDSKSTSHDISQETVHVTSPVIDECMEAKHVSPYRSNQDKDEQSLKKLVKQKHEHKLMTTRAFEETYIDKFKARLITNECKTNGSRKGRREAKISKKSNSKEAQIGTNRMDELDGWTTTSKSLNDQDNVQMSSTYLLHPIESFESVYTPMSTSLGNTPLCTPLWTSLGNTPLCEPADQQFAEEQQNDTESPENKPASLTQPTPVNGTLSDLEYKYSDNKERVKKSSEKELGVPGDYKKAANSVKLRLTKSIPFVSTEGEQSAYKPLAANVPLSQCVNYSIKRSMRTGGQLTTSINLSEKLAQQLKELSGQSTKSNPRHQDGTTQQSFDQKSLKQSSSSKASSFYDSTLRQNVFKPFRVKNEERVRSLRNIHEASAADFEPKLGSPIPRQKGKEHHALDQSQSESFDLPPISVRSFPVRNPQKACSMTVKTQETDNNCPSNRGVAVRVGLCTSPYMFDKEDPRTLHLHARPLLPEHSVCTGCGGIFDGREITGKLNRKSKSDLNETSNKFKQIRERCFYSNMDDRWKLDRKIFDQSDEFLTVGVENLETTCGKKTFQREESTARQLVSSQTSRKHKCEEMSIKLMDNNTMFRFQCDLTVDDTGHDAEQPGSTTDEWLSSRSAPKCIERFQCPLTAETRIYKEDLRKSLNSRYSTTNSPMSSPYLDYCKYKAELIAKRNEELKEQIELIPDTCLTDDVYMKAESKSRQYPVIPIKKRQDGFKAMNKYATGIVKALNHSYHRKASDVDLSVESTRRLPVIKTDPFLIPRENTNNNGYTLDGFSDDVSCCALVF